MNFKPKPYHGVMISSTFTDLKDYRAVAIKLLQSSELMPVAMEHSTAQCKTDISSSLEMVDRASAYILVIGEKYGRTPFCSQNNPQYLSLTELEFHRAQQLNKPILVFLMDDNHPRMLENVETDVDKQRKLILFKERAKQWQPGSELWRVYDEFNSLQEFTEKLGPAIAKLKQKIDPPLSDIPTQVIVSTKNTESVPESIVVGAQAPALYANPPYLGGHEFLGRADQLAVLDEWALVHDPRPMLLFEAMGGSGKSILSWSWLVQRSEQVRTDWAGRFWYSFYDRGAETRDFLIKALSYMCGNIDGRWYDMLVEELTKYLISQLTSRPYLLVLDGVERLLVDYNRFDAQYREDSLAGTSDQLSRRQPLSMVRDEDSHLFRCLLTASPSKILVTSRLLPLCLVNHSHQTMPGLLHHHLSGLTPDDAESLFRACGVSGESESIRHYLKENCDCHPLVVGVLAGLVNRYLAARGDFDQWKTAPAGGLALDLSTLDLIGRQNHILSAAMAALPENSRELITTLAMVLNEFDYNVLLGLWPLSSDGSTTVFQETVADLEDHGFLLFDRQTRLYDLHPVVRSVVIGRALPETRERAGERVIDYFSTAATKPLSEAETLEDVQGALHVVQTYLTIGKMEQAWEILNGPLFHALWLNLERHEKILELLRPFFNNNWLEFSETTPEGAKHELINLAAISLGAVGFKEEACACSMGYFISALEKNDPKSLLIPLSNLAWAAYDMKFLCLAYRIGESTEMLAEVLCDDQGLFSSYLFNMMIAADLGKRDEVEAYWLKLNKLGWDWEVNTYRPGGAEYRRAACLLMFGELDEALLSAAENAVSGHKVSRRYKRNLHSLRGHWHFQRGEYELACHNLECAVDMSRMASLRDVRSETLLALARYHNNTLLDAHEEAARLAKEKDREELELASLWEALGEPERALKHAKIAYQEACLEGEAWAYRHRLKGAQAMIERLDASLPLPGKSRDRWPVEVSNFPKTTEFLFQLYGLIEQVRHVNQTAIALHAQRSDEERMIARKGHLVHKLRARDSTGRWAYYFVLVKPRKEDEFIRAINGDGTIDLENFGEVVASCYGQEPNQEVKDLLYTKYGFEV